MTTEPAAPSTERSRSMMIAAVYGDGTPPTWFIQRLDDVIAAARAEAAREVLDRDRLIDAIAVALPVPTMLDVDFAENTADAILAAIDEASRATPDEGSGK